MGLKDVFHLYPDEIGAEDTVGDSGYLTRVMTAFGTRCLRGTALVSTKNVDGMIEQADCEMFLRSVFDKIRPRLAIEIGTLFGVTTTLLAHYSDKVLTIDLNHQQLATYIKHYFGVEKKIVNLIVKDDEEKAEVLASQDFDFTFIDAMHTYDGVKGDFDMVKKCGKVLFHDYGQERFQGVTDFIDELPDDEVIKKTPFAYWEKRNG